MAPVFDQIFIKTTGNLRWLKHINYILQACAIFFLETDLQTSPEYDDKKIEIVPGWQLPETLATIVWKIVLVDNWLSAGTFDFSKINFTCFSGRGGIAITLPNFFTRTWYNQSKCLYLKRSDISDIFNTLYSTCIYCCLPSQNLNVTVAWRNLNIWKRLALWLNC